MATALAAASFVVGAAGAVSQHQAGKAEAKANNDWVNQNAQRAAQATRDQYADLQLQREQERQAAAQEKQDISLDAIKARATARVAAGEAGVSGLSVDQLIADYYDRELTAKDRINQQTEWKSQQIANQMSGVKAQGDDRINSQRMKAGPSFFDAGLRIVGAGIDSYSNYMKWSDPDGGLGRKGKK
ncbi:MAG: hypothetical protein ACK4FJ_18585 [Ferrovibrio sp.]|uniref:virion core protein, T7 gp14 family n=1 Tax=Ferrovibrio sp. TaxID=1917215 RepID=UPI0039187C1C